VTNDDFTRTTKTKKASYLNGHSWYRNTLMVTKKREMKGCWDFGSNYGGILLFSKIHFFLFF
jgi:hypothetical protein